MLFALYKVISLYSVLIIDDECIVVNGLAYDIDWHALKIDTVHKAYSGLQAHKFLKNNRVDLILSDIRMPGLNGLELTGIINRNWPYSKVILITGYDDFQYAKQAVSLGVSDLITKPIDYEQLQGAVCNAISEIEYNLDQLSRLDQAMEQLKDMMPVLQERNLNRWIIKNKNMSELNNNLVKCNSLVLNADQSGFLVMFREDNWSENSDISDQYFKIQLKHIIDHFMIHQFNTHLIDDDSGHHLLLVSNKNIDMVRLANVQIEQTVSLVQNMIVDKLGCLVSVFWSPIKPISEMPKLYQSLLFKSEVTTRWQRGIISGVDSEQLRSEMIQLIDPFKPSLVVLLAGLKKYEAKERIKCLFEQLKLQSSCPGYQIIELYHSITYSFINVSNRAEIPLHDWADSFVSFFYSYDQIKSIDEMMNICMTATDRLIDYLSSCNTKKNNYFIEEAKLFIHLNIDSDLSLKAVSDHIHLHPNYLSRLFHEIEGGTVIEYIINIKMERAKELLHDSERKIYEVARLSGYESVSHFSRLFKRMTGLSPKDYQNILKNRHSKS